MALKFGTSGVRGLVTEMTDKACYSYALAFGKVLQQKSNAQGVIIAGDHRNSSPRILGVVTLALESIGFTVVNAGFVPTPAIALSGEAFNMGAVMVTGSHIPEDRNGIKFYMPWGEILKDEELEITEKQQQLTAADFADEFDKDDRLYRDILDPTIEHWIAEKYIKRYTELFSNNALAGMKLLVYQHSTVLRDMLPLILESLGASVISVGRSEQFIPLDTEAVHNPEQLKSWVEEYQADALLSADGDGDRPLLVMNSGNVIRGDVLGVLAAKALSADAVATPVSCNSQVEKCGAFKTVVRTKIGSPWVIQAMNELSDEGYSTIVGYEANGGFLTGSRIQLNNTHLSPLPTRDAVLPMLMVLTKVHASSWDAVFGNLPNRVTDSLLLRGINMQSGKRLLEQMSQSKEAAQQIVGGHFSHVNDLNVTDGVRLTFDDETVVHFRPSGNAPEFRAYIEAESESVTSVLRDKAEKFLLSHISD